MQNCKPDCVSLISPSFLLLFSLTFLFIFLQLFYLPSAFLPSHLLSPLFIFLFQILLLWITNMCVTHVRVHRYFPLILSWLAESYVNNPIIFDRILCTLAFSEIHPPWNDCKNVRSLTITKNIQIEHQRYNFFLNFFTDSTFF